MGERERETSSTRRQKRESVPDPKKKTFAAVSFCVLLRQKTKRGGFCAFKGVLTTTTTMMTTTSSFPRGGEFIDAKSGIARASCVVHNNAQRARFARCASTSGNTNTNAMNNNTTTNARGKPASSSTMRKCFSTAAFFGKGRWKCTLERRRHHRHRGASSMALFAAATTIPGLSSMKKADLVRCCEERGLDASGKVPELRQRLRDAVSSSDRDDDDDDGDDDFAASGERRGETVAVVEATKSDGGFAKETTLFSIKDEADDEEQDAIARKLAVELAVEADDTRAKDVRVLQVSKAVYYARYVVLATAFNRPQMSAVTSKMRDVANNETYNLQIPKNVANQGDWTCLDCRDVVAHVFTPTARTYYDLEDLYRECDEVGLPFETERTHDGFYAEEDGDFYENEDEDESEDLEDEFEINWSEM